MILLTPHRRDGFSLIELMIALTIMGILSQVMAPNFRGLMNNLKLKNATQILVLDIRRTQQLAITSQETCGLKFISSHEYQLLQGKKTISTKKLIQGIEISESSEVKIAGGIFFDSLGIPLNEQFEHLSNNNNTIQSLGYYDNWEKVNKALEDGYTDSKMLSGENTE